MRRLIRRLGVLALLVPLALSAAPPVHAQPGGGAGARDVAEVAYFEFTDVTRERFVFALADSDKIEHARRILDGEETERVHVVGRILKRQAPYNPRWSYHLNPETIDFFEYAIEVCDATIPFVEDHLDEAGGAFLPGLVWCPWTSQLTRELPNP
ncbi:BP74-related protein [Actinokineospora iranica]|uniref:BP74 N-terminal domain-containing protein n=1 Tax=Actinokineospora iranica TaxID=1271860 RepID=A0A1G6KC23_9PSEU|nr:calmodulin-binding protein [Actinokineospora iranica]SDC28503.1 hypothetical protein SAMN05216174_101826 [Actinokineospora iranica]